MTLNPLIRRNPTEAAINRLFDGYLEELASMSGLGGAFVQGALHMMQYILLDGVHDLIERVAAVTPGTGNLIISFRIRDCLGRAFTRPTQNLSICHF